MCQICAHGDTCRPAVPQKSLGPRPVIPAKVGIQGARLNACLRGNDEHSASAVPVPTSLAIAEAKGAKHEFAQSGFCAIASSFTVVWRILE
jgi:hypothetical protein